MFGAECLECSEVREEIDRAIALLALSVDVGASVDKEEDDRNADAHCSVIVRHVPKEQVVNLRGVNRKRNRKSVIYILVYIHMLKYMYWYMYHHTVESGC